MSIISGLHIFSNECRSSSICNKKNSDYLYRFEIGNKNKETLTTASSYP